jgi:glyoxylase-like metal-dependent hydrolase (beta-lactamase superfamily II)
MAPVSAQQPDKQPAIEKITDNLFRAFNGGVHHTVYLVTSEGIILADPLSVKFSKWLKVELASRHDVPVRYVLYTHYHQDHAAGGEVFADTAEFIGHENMLPNLAKMKDDKNYAAVLPPTITYSENMTVSLGGKTVELIHALPSHTDDSTIMLFREERTAHAVDWINIKRLPYTKTHGAPVSAWIESLEQLQTLDFDIIAPGHGASVGSRADVEDYKQYLQLLADAVAKGIKQGNSMEQLQKSINLEAYKDWELYEFGAKDNIRAVYSDLKNAH